MGKTSLSQPASVVRWVPQDALFLPDRHPRYSCDSMPVVPQPAVCRRWRRCSLRTDSGRQTRVFESCFVADLIEPIVRFFTCSFVIIFSDDLSFKFVRGIWRLHLCGVACKGVWMPWQTDGDALRFDMLGELTGLLIRRFSMEPTDRHMGRHWLARVRVK